MRGKYGRQEGNERGKGEKDMANEMGRENETVEEEVKNGREEE